MSMRFFVALLALVVASALAPAANAGFTGTTLNATYYFPTPPPSAPYAQASFSPPTFVVNAGLETTGNIEGVTFLAVNFTDTSLTIDFTTTLPDPTLTPTEFNGPIFTLVGPGSLNIASASVNPSTTFAGFDASRVGFSDGQLSVSLGGLSYQTGSRVAIDFTFTPVPEPASLALTGIGLAGAVGVALRKRGRKA